VLGGSVAIETLVESIEFETESREGDTIILEGQIVFVANDCVIEADMAVIYFQKNSDFIDRIKFSGGLVLHESNRSIVGGDFAFADFIMGRFRIFSTRPRCYAKQIIPVVEEEDGGGVVHFKRDAFSRDDNEE
jgi:hypothetical protein